MLARFVQRCLSKYQRTFESYNRYSIDTLNPLHSLVRFYKLPISSRSFEILVQLQSGFTFPPCFMIYSESAVFLQNFFRQADGITKLKQLLVLLYFKFYQIISSSESH